MNHYVCGTIFLNAWNFENSLNGNYSETKHMSALTQFLKKILLDFAVNYVLNKLSRKQKQLKMLEDAILANAKGEGANKAKEYAKYFLTASQELGIELTTDVVLHIASQLGHETQDFRFHVEQSRKGVNEYEYFEGLYGMKKSLGNTEKGDGYKYRGRGFIQLTGKTNYQRYGEKLGLDLVNNPDLVLNAKVSAKVALLYFKDHVLGKLTYQDFEQDVINVSKAINFPAAKVNEQINGLADRLLRAKRTKDALKC